MRRGVRATRRRRGERCENASRARLDATRGATTRARTDDGSARDGDAVGAYFNDDDAALEDDDAARSLLEALRDAHAALTLETAKTLEAHGSAGRCFREEISNRARASREATKATIRAASARAREGRAANVRRGVGAIWEASKAFAKAPKDAVRAVAARLMTCARFVKDVDDEMRALGEDEEGAAASTRTDEDDLRFCDDDFSETEMANAKALRVFVGECVALLKALILPTVKEKTARLEALEPIVDACLEFQNCVEEIGAGAYPPQDVDDLKVHVRTAREAGKKMFECVRDAGIGDETENAFTRFDETGASVSLRVD